MSVRAEKVGSVIKRSLSTHISRLASENSFGLASISMVKLSKDLSVASVYINLWGNKKTPNDFLALINKKTGYLRAVVAKEVRMRFTPELRFFYDDTLDQIQQIQGLIDKVNAESPCKEEYGDTLVYDEKLLIKLEGK